MKRILSTLAVIGVLGASATAAPKMDVSETTLDTRSEIVQALYDLELVSTAERLRGSLPGQTVEAQFLPPPTGACEGYQPPQGCYVVYNDGEFCTQYCGLFLEICDCSV